MADKENCVPRLTRAAAKRAAAAAAANRGVTAKDRDRHQPPAKRKRVALGELPTLSNAVVPLPLLSSSSDLSTPPPSKPKSKTRRKQEVKTSAAAAELSSEAESEEDDPQMCSHYASDIHQYLRSMEVEPKRRPLVNFIEKVQTDVTANMRGILVDWLVEVAEEYKLISDTLYLTVSYIDRFLSHIAISRQKLQLLGVSSMLIASKYEEITPPHVEDFCYITDNTYTKQEVVKMESDVLKFLKFEIGNPTVKTFLRRFVKAGQQDDKRASLQFEFMGNYLAELSLIDYACVQFLPSIVAAAVVFVARFTVFPKVHPWSKSLQECTGYRVSDLKDCIHFIRELQMNKKASSFTAIREKYKNYKFKCVALVVPSSEIPANYFEDFND